MKKIKLSFKIIYIKRGFRKEQSQENWVRKGRSCTGKKKKKCLSCSVSSEIEVAVPGALAVTANSTRWQCGDRLQPPAASVPASQACGHRLTAPCSTIKACLALLRRGFARVRREEVVSVSTSNKGNSGREELAVISPALAVFSLSLEIWGLD